MAVLITGVERVALHRQKLEQHTQGWLLLLSSPLGRCLGWCQSSGGADLDVSWGDLGMREHWGLCRQAGQLSWHTGLCSSTACLPQWELLLSWHPGNSEKSLCKGSKPSLSISSAGNKAGSHQEMCKLRFPLWESLKHWVERPQGCLIAQYRNKCSKSRSELMALGVSKFIFVAGRRWWSQDQWDFPCTVHSKFFTTSFSHVACWITHYRKKNLKIFVDSLSAITEKNPKKLKNPTQKTPTKLILGVF